MSFSWSQNQPILCSAPMHGITNSAQRQIFKKFGADCVFTEMISTQGIKYTNPKTLAKINFLPKEKPVIVQIFGNTIPETISSAKLAEKLGAAGLDFNCGCPARSMIASGNGGKLLLEPDKLIEILTAIKKNTKLPISLKTRIGYDKILPPSFYQKIVTSSGIDCLILHGRTVKQQYSGYSNWEHIKKIVSLLAIPVIGNGDITNPYQAIDRLKNFTPAGIMIGRSALGKPWIFSQVKKLLSGRSIRPRTNIRKIIRILNTHYRLLEKEFLRNPYYLQKYSISEIKLHVLHNMRKHFGWYFHDFPNAKSIRIDLIQIDSPSAIKNYLEKLSEKY